jgi:glycine hydroxymethyltransferase
MTVHPSFATGAATGAASRRGPAGVFAERPRLRATDPPIADLLEAELCRQEETLELIPSENLVSPAVLEALGSWLNNKYAEGTPGKRYYGGCQIVDQVEDLCRERAKALFGADHANVQPHSGSQANMSVYASVLQPGDPVLGMALDQGGHLTHGSPVSFSGRLYHFEPYYVSETTGRLDMAEVRRRAEEVRPHLIVAGYSSYPRFLDFTAFREIADSVGAMLMVDMAHFAGLVAGGVHPSPVPHADFVTLTTHKTLRGPWGGMILCRSEYADRIDRAVCPGNQGGPMLHAIAAKAVMLQQCSQPEFRDYARRVVANAAALARHLADRGCVLTTGGTDKRRWLRAAQRGDQLQPPRRRLRRADAQDPGHRRRQRAPRPSQRRAGRGPADTNRCRRRTTGRDQLRAAAGMKMRRYQKTWAVLSPPLRTAGWQAFGGLVRLVVIRRPGPSLHAPDRSPGRVAYRR